jgi:ankyrin repeat protein
MTLLLDERLDPNISDIDNKCCLLTLCYNQKYHLAFEMLINSENIDPNTVNLEDSTTTFGLMFLQANLDTKHYINKGY